MYWENFGFKEAPFALTPNPAFLFLSAPHQEAFAHLLFAIENRAGFIELSGEVGTGKTTVVRTLLSQLDPENYRTALIFNPTLSPLGLLKEINGEFGLPCDCNETRELHQALNGFLLEENRAGRTVVLVIDEAQNLAVEVLEQVRLISNLETDSDKLIQIVLVGQPELKLLLARSELRQLTQRITVRYHLKPMGQADTGDYIRHRIRFAAEGREPLVFQSGAVQRIYRYSGGLPRLINGVCDRALLLAYTRNVKDVTTAMVALSIKDLRKEGPPRLGRSWWFKAAACLTVLAVLGLAAYRQVREEEAVQTAAVAALPPQPAPLSRQAALSALAAVSEQQNLYASVNAVLAAWQMPALAPVPGQPASLKTLAKLRGLTATTVTGDLQDLSHLDAPALLPLTLADGSTRLLALTAIDREGVTVAPALDGRSRLSRAELAQFWNRGATVLWKDFHAIAAAKLPAERPNAVRQLQEMLKQTSCYDGPVNGVFTVATKDAVKEFQRREHLTVDGQPGGATLLLLYRRAGGFFPPGIVKDGGKAAWRHDCSHTRRLA
jgi:general secretion pathway protein A